MQICEDVSKYFKYMNKYIRYIKYINFPNSEKCCGAIFSYLVQKRPRAEKKTADLAKQPKKQASGPIQAGPPRKVSMSQASFGRNHLENVFLVKKTNSKPSFLWNSRLTPAQEPKQNISKFQ